MKKSVMTYGQEIRNVYNADSLFIILKNSANKPYEFGGNIFDRFGAGDICSISFEYSDGFKRPDYSFPWNGPDEGANKYMTIEYIDEGIAISISENKIVQDFLEQYQNWTSKK